MLQLPTLFVADEVSDRKRTRRGMANVQNCFRYEQRVSTMAPLHKQHGRKHRGLRQDFDALGML